jgi:hypothetical protein
LAITGGLIVCGPTLGEVLDLCGGGSNQIEVFLDVLPVSLNTHG